MPEMKRVLVRRALEGETVEIQWTLLDGRVYCERHTCPPRATRDVRIESSKGQLLEKEIRS